MFVDTKSNYVEVHPTDPAFRFVDGICMVNRAAIKISDSCPANIIRTLQMALEQGWIEPVAYLKYNEYCWDRLSQAGEQ